MDSDPAANRRAELEAELARARCAGRQMMFQILASKIEAVDLQKIQRDAREMEAASGRVAAIASLLASL